MKTSLILSTLDIGFVVGLFIIFLVMLGIWAIHRKNEQSRIGSIIWKYSVLTSDTYAWMVLVYFGLRFTIIKYIVF